MKSTPGNLHRRFDRLLRSAELVRNIEEGEAAKWTNHDSRIRKKSNHDPPGKNCPGMLCVKSIGNPLVNHGGR